MPQKAPHFTRLLKSSTIGYKLATLWLSTVCETIQLFASTKIRFWATLKPVLITLLGKYIEQPKYESQETATDNGWRAHSRCRVISVFIRRSL